MIDKIKCKKKIGTDIHSYLIAVLNKLSEGWIPPEEVTEEMYKDIQNNKDIYSIKHYWKPNKSYIAKNGKELNESLKDCKFIIYFLFLL